MRRFVICTDETFPHGGAGANYIYYFAKAIKEIGYAPFVLSYINTPQGNMATQNYNGISYQYVSCRAGKISHYLDFNFFFHNLYVDRLEQLDLTKEDIIWIYSAEYPLVHGVRTFSQKKQIMVGASVVEWYTLYKAQPWKDVWKYWRYQYLFKHELVKVHNLITISSYLEQYYVNKGCHTLCLPPLIDIDEVSTDAKPCAYEEEIIKLIYPGGKSNKDDLAMLLDVLSELCDIPYELYITGISIDDLKKRVSLSEERWNRILPRLRLPGWLSYEELTALYEKMDYFVILREENPSTLANFPSKIPECMSYGIIPIVSKIGDYGNKYLTDGKDSFLVESNIRDAVKHVVDNALRLSASERSIMSENARRTAMGRFDIRGLHKNIYLFLQEGCR